MIPAIYADRAEQIAQEVREGTVGELATPLEVMAYMHPATINAPLSYEWVQVYLYCRQEALLNMANFQMARPLPKLR